MNFLNFKYIIAFVVVVIIFALGFMTFSYYSNKHYKSQNEQLMKDNILKQEVTNTLTREVETGKVVATVNNEVVKETVERIKKDDEQDIVIRSALEKKINEIKHRRSTKPTVATQINAVKEASNVKKTKPTSTPSTAATGKVAKTVSEKTEDEEETKEISEARIQSIWEHYCLTVDSSDKDCAASQPQPGS